VDEETGNEAQTEQPVVAPVANVFVETIGLIIKNNQLHYWLSPRDADEAVDRCFGVLRDLLRAAEQVTVHCSHDELLVNEGAIGAESAHVTSLIHHLNARHIHEFAIGPEVTIEQFRQFMAALEIPPDAMEQEEGFANIIASRGIDNIAVRTVVYKEVADDEVVLSTRKFGVDKGRAQTVENVLAFLNGDVEQPTKQTLDRIDEIASDSRKLVELIMKAADIREQPQEVEQGESLASIVVGSLRRVMQTVVSTPAAGTKRGRKRIAKTLVMLERDMLETLRAMAGEADFDTMSTVSTAIREIRDEVEIEDLADDYIKKRRAMEQSEERVLRYMRSKGLEDVVDGDLKQRLTGDGVEHAEFQDLVRRSGAQSGLTAQAPGAPGSEFSALQHIAVLLSRLQNIVDQVGDKVQEEETTKLVETAVSVQQAVATATEGTERKIQQLADEIEEEKKAEESGDGRKQSEPGDPPRMSRGRMLEILAEIVQELCQPLSVINCTLQMMLSGKLGDVSESQTAMIKLAQESSDRIKMLTDSLRRISGEPETLSPDLTITSSFYQQ
jgi:hypothetical protein